MIKNYKTVLRTLKKRYSGAALEKWIKRLKRANEAKKIAGIEIRANWYRSKMWGMCPRVTVDFTYDDRSSEKFTASASGCGYDKFSAAVNSAIADAPAMDRLLIENKNCWTKYGVSYTDTLDYPKLWINGTGMSVFRALFDDRFKAAPIKGFTYEHFEDPKWDLIIIRRKSCTWL